MLDRREWPGRNAMLVRVPGGTAGFSIRGIKPAMVVDDDHLGYSGMIASVE